MRASSDIETTRSLCRLNGRAQRAALAKAQALHQICEDCAQVLHQAVQASAGSSETVNAFLPITGASEFTKQLWEALTLADAAVAATQVRATGDTRVALGAQHYRNVHSFAMFCCLGQLLGYNTF